MATLTLKAKNPNTMVPDTQVYGSAFKAISGVKYPTIGNIGGSARGYDDVYTFNLYDLTKSIYPSANYKRSQMKGILVTEVGRYNNDLTEIPITSVHNLRCSAASTNNISVPLTANTFVDINSIMSSMLNLEVGITVYSYDINTNDPSYPITIPNGLYFKYKIQKLDNSYSDQYIIRIIKGSTKVGFLRFTEICDLPINIDTINIIKINNIINLNERKVTQNNNPENMETLGQTSPLLYLVKPQALTGVPAYISKLYFSNSTFYEGTQFFEDEIVDERLIYDGSPVMYGQGVPTEGINNGLLQYNTIGLTQTQINNLKLYVMYEGVLSALSYVK